MKGPPMEELITFLRARLDEDETLSLRNIGERGLGDTGSFPDYRTYSDEDTHAADDYLNQFAPPRMLREVKVKQKILQRHERLTGSRSCQLCWPLRCDIYTMAAVWDQHPDYRPEWAP